MKRGLALAAVVVTATMVTASGNATTPQSRIVFSADRAPSVWGEIYRVKPNGRRVDLSRSPAEDTNPAVSPDGRHVAFVSNRFPKGAVYEVRVNGQGLRRISPRTRFGFDNSTMLVWQPHGTELAVNATNGLWILQPGHKAINATANGDGLALSNPWSPDGRILVVQTPGRDTVALSPDGHRLWSVHGPAIAWSQQGLLAVIDGKKAVAVHNESGQLRFTVKTGGQNPSGSWSPDGSRLALIVWPTLREWTSTGQLVLDKRLHNARSGIAWAGQNQLIVAQEPSSWFAPRSADGTLAIVTSPAPRSPAPNAKQGARFKLGVASPGSSRIRAYTHVPGCWGDFVWDAAVSSLQFAGRSIVYQTACAEPFSNLYSVEPDGSGLRRIAGVAPYATQPAISPDGTEIAYSWAKLIGMSCAGCPSQIRVANSDGTGMRMLTNPSDAFDVSPTWSPDGQTILFSESNPNNSGELYTVPAAGGAVHDLGLAGKDPTWGPTRIAYQQGGVWTANPDGTDPVQVAKNAELPAWSSDGRLAYIQGSSGGPTLVVGTATVQLPFASVSSLAWSPDGSSFVITASKILYGPPDVYTIKTDGTDPVQLTKNFDASGAAWR